MTNETDILARIKQQILEEQRHYLCQYICPENHYSYLRSKNNLTRDDEELINSRITRMKKVEEFLNILSTRGSTAYDNFCESLRNSKTQIFILEHLNKELEKKRKPFRQKQMTIDDIKPSDDYLPGPGFMNKQPNKSFNSSDA